MTLEEIYFSKCNDNSDICQHMPTLKKYAEMSDSIVEFGVRSIVSTWAFLMGKPKILLSVDIHHPSYYRDYDPNGCNLELVMKIAKEQGTGFDFIQASSLEIFLSRVDTIFFDTLHTYEQLSNELLLHGKMADKFLIFHDTETYKSELMPAIEEFCHESQMWGVREKFDNNNGLLILQRISLP